MTKPFPGGFRQCVPHTVPCREPFFPTPYPENCPPAEKGALPRKGSSGGLNLQLRLGG